MRNNTEKEFISYSFNYTFLPRSPSSFLPSFIKAFFFYIFVNRLLNATFCTFLKPLMA